MDRQEQDPEDRIKDLLLRDESDVETGIELIHRSYGDVIGCWIQRCFCSLSPEDVADAWQDTLFCVAQMAADRQFKKDGSLFALLSGIMRWRSIDILNANTKYQQALEKYREKVACSDAMDEVHPLFLDEVFHLISEGIDDLPPRQKTVWEAYRDCGFSVRTLSELVEALEEATGVSQTHNSVRRARQEGRDKIREYLRRRGYGQ